MTGLNHSIYRGVCWEEGWISKSVLALPLLLVLVQLKGISCIFILNVLRAGNVGYPPHASSLLPASFVILLSSCLRNVRCWQVQ